MTDKKMTDETVIKKIISHMAGEDPDGAVWGHDTQIYNHIDDLVEEIKKDLKPMIEKARLEGEEEGRRKVIEEVEKYMKSVMDMNIDVGTEKQVAVFFIQFVLKSGDLLSKLKQSQKEKEAM